MAHARRDRRSDHLYRLECQGCGAISIPCLGGEVEEQVLEEGRVELLCASCGKRAVHLDVTGGRDD